MSFHLDFDKTIDENIVSASKVLGFTPMSSKELINVFRSMPQSGGEPHNWGKQFGNRNWMTTRRGDQYPNPAIRRGRQANLHENAVGAAGQGAVNRGEAASGSCSICIAAIVAIGFLWYILPSFLHDGGGDTMTVLEKSIQPVYDELYKAMGPSYFFHLTGFAEGILVKSCAGKKNVDMLTLSKSDFNLLNEETLTGILAILVKKSGKSKRGNVNANKTRKNQSAKNSIPA